MSDLYIRITRPEGYEDIHPDLILQDMNINPVWGAEVVDVEAVLRASPTAARLVSAMAAYYNARTQAKETIAKVAQYNNSSALEAAIKNQSADLGLLDTKIKALLSEAQAIAQMATALFNNIPSREQL